MELENVRVKSVLVIRRRKVSVIDGFVHNSGVCSVSFNVECGKFE